MLFLEMPRDAVAPEPLAVPARTGTAARARALAALALPVHPGLPLADSLTLGKQALELAVDEADAQVLAYAAANLGTAALAGGRSWGWSLVEQGVSAARAAGDRRELARILLNAVCAALWLGDHPRARSLVLDLGVVAVASGCGWLGGRVDILEGELSFRSTGRVSEGSNLDDEGDPEVALLKARVSLLAGDPEWAELILLPIAEKGFHDGFPDLAASASARLAEIAMEKGDGQASISWAGRAVAPARLGGVAWWGDVLVPAVAALCRHDMISEAEEVLLDAELGLKDATAPRAEAALLHARGMLAESSGRVSQARSMYLAASRRFGELPDHSGMRATADALSRVSVLSDS